MLQMHLVLGAGLAGLTLAQALVEHAPGEPVVIADRRTTFPDDRTWCFWDTGLPQRTRPPVAHRWHRWQLVGRGGTVVEQSSARHPYTQVRAGAFAEDALARLAAVPEVELRLGERVTVVAPGDDHVALHTSRGTLRGSHAYDAMGGGGPLAQARPDGAIELQQTFLGLEVETATPAFDPAVATLMDFRCGPAPGADPSGGLHFIYVLPTSPTRALVEHTTLGPRAVPAAVRRAEIGAYLEAICGAGSFAVVREERGTLPMSSHVFPMGYGPRLHAVGAAAGAVRPSSGYALVRTLRHVDALARAVAADAPLPVAIAHPRHRLLDQLFLRALAVDPPSFDTSLLALARRTDGETFARFMTDTSTLRDEATVMAALTRPGFLWPMAASSLLRPLPR